MRGGREEGEALICRQTLLSEWCESSKPLNGIQAASEQRLAMRAEASAAQKQRDGCDHLWD